MNLFDKMLGANESLFANELALDYDFLPKLLPYREAEQRQIASCINPLLQQRNGRNLFIHGAPGIGKTAAMRFVIRDLEEETDDVVPIYINCWQKNTTYKVILEMCEQLGYRLTHNKKSEELFGIIKQMLNKKCVVFAFDEIDKVEDYDFLYTILEEIYKKSVILITNHKEWLVELDQRIKSRLLPEIIEFRQYSPAETCGILKERLGYAFVPGVWDDEAFDIAATRASQIKDVRTGLYLLRQAGLVAESEASRKIDKDHVQKAIHKLDEFTIKSPEKLEDETKMILNIIKDNSEKKIGDLFKLYQAAGGNSVYKTFQRKIRKLADAKFITLKKLTGGAEGTTTIISFNNVKKLTDF